MDEGVVACRPDVRSLVVLDSQTACKEGLSDPLEIVLDCH